MTMTAPNRPEMYDVPEGYRFPIPPFPTGWFQVAYSDELEAGAVVPLQYFGEHLVLYRDNEGVAHVLDAFCPHLGAHLGYGGVVEDNCIRCPFHAWRFDGGGRCIEIPYAEKIPSQAKLRSWPVFEANGLIMVHHHIAGGEPGWELPKLAEYNSDAWTPYVRRRWKVRTHNQEMAENAVDSAHFKYVAGSGLPSSCSSARSMPSKRASKSCAMPAVSRISRPWRLEVTTPVFTPRRRNASTSEIVER